MLVIYVKSPRFTPPCVGFRQTFSQTAEEKQSNVKRCFKYPGLRKLGGGCNSELSIPHLVPHLETRSRTVSSGNTAVFYDAKLKHIPISDRMI